jgi:hypothetical protein
MEYFIILFISIILFFSLFYNLSKPVIESLVSTSTTNTMTTNIIPTKVDSIYLQQKMQELMDLQSKIVEIRETLYSKELSDFFQINCNYKNNDSVNPQQFSVDIKNEGNFSHIITIDVGVGEIGVAGLPGDTGPQGIQGLQGEKGPVGDCGAIVN